MNYVPFSFVQRFVIAEASIWSHSSSGSVDREDLQSDCNAEYALLRKFKLFRKPVFYFCQLLETQLFCNWSLPLRPDNVHITFFFLKKCISYAGENSLQKNLDSFPMFIKNFLCSVAPCNDAINVVQVFRSFSLFQCTLNQPVSKKEGRVSSPGAILTRFASPSLYAYVGLLWPSAKPCTLPCWTSFGSHQPTLKVCWGHSGWQHFLVMCQPQHSAWCHQQTCWGCTQAHHQCHWWRQWRALAPRQTPWGTLLITGLHLDTVPFNSTLCLWLSNQQVIHQIVHSTNPYLSNLKIRMWWRTMPKALHKSR